MLQNILDICSLLSKLSSQDPSDSNRILPLRIDLEQEVSQICHRTATVTLAGFDEFVSNPSYTVACASPLLRLNLISSLLSHLLNLHHLPQIRLYALQINSRGLCSSVIMSVDHLADTIVL
jgi:hypothetical protein